MANEDEVRRDEAHPLDTDRRACVSDTGAPVNYPTEEPHA
jgi:hypothetical protein